MDSEARLCHLKPADARQYRAKGSTESSSISASVSDEDSRNVGSNDGLE